MRISAMSHNEPGGCRYDRALASGKLAAMNEDDICRVALADADMTRRFLRLLPARATAELDPRRLRRLPTEHVAPGGQRRRADMAWAVGLLAPADAKAEALLALEFQSSPDSAMALRMEAYVALLRQETIAEGGPRAGRRLPTGAAGGGLHRRPALATGDARRTDGADASRVEPLAGAVRVPAGVPAQIDLAQPRP